MGRGDQNRMGSLLGAIVWNGLKNSLRNNSADRCFGLDMDSPHLTVIPMNRSQAVLMKILILY